MTFDPFSTIPQPPSENGPVPAAGNPPAQNPFATGDDDDDEIHFDLTGEGGVPVAQPVAAPVPMAEPELRVELTPVTPPAPPAPTFTAPWEMPAQPAVQPTSTFSLDLSSPTTPPSPTPVTSTPTPSNGGGAGLVGLFDRLVNMIEEETKAFEASQRKHQANIANEQHQIEEETRAFEKKKADILKGVEDLKKKLSA